MLSRLSVPRSKTLALLIALGAATCGLLHPQSAQTQNQSAPLAAFSFDGELQGFQAVTIGASGLQPDDQATLTVSKDTVKEGSGALSYSYRAIPGALRGLASGELRLPPQTRSLRFWVRSNTATALILNLHEENGATYGTQFFVPEQAWVPIHLNLDELTLGEDAKDDNQRLDIDRVRTFSLLDLSVWAANLIDGKQPQVIDPQRSRQLWLDEVQFLADPAPKAGGPVTQAGQSSFVLDNFTHGIVRWLPVKALFNPAEPRFELFPARSSLEVRPEIPANAAKPGAGNGILRYEYSRNNAEVWALIRSLNHLDLKQARGVEFRVRATQPTALLLGLKERDGSEYQHAINLDPAQGWQTVRVAFSELKLAENSQGKNNQLDADQLKELTIVDASMVGGLPGGEVLLELGEIRFILR